MVDKMEEVERNSVAEIYQYNGPLESECLNCTWTPSLALASSKISSLEELWLWNGRLKYNSGQSHHPVMYICKFTPAN